MENNNSNVLLYYRHFESLLIQSGRELNVAVDPVYFPYNVPLHKYERIETVELVINNFLKNQKSLNPPIELVVVIIPDYPPGIYGK